MRNRERFIKSSLYDRLCEMNTNLSKVGDCACIIDALHGNYEVGNIRCEEHKTGDYERDCNQCIADWLNEERW